MVRVLDNLSTGKKENLRRVRREDRVHRRRYPGSRDVPPGRRRGAEHVLHQAALASVAAFDRRPPARRCHQCHGHAQHAPGRAGTPGSGASSWPPHPPSTATTRRLPKVEGRGGQAPVALCGQQARRREVRPGLPRPPWDETPSPCAISTCSARARTRPPSTAAVIPLFITKILRGERPTIYGDGEQSRDFIFVGNVVRANLVAAASAAAAGEVHQRRLRRRDYGQQASRRP